MASYANVSRDVLYGAQITLPRREPASNHEASQKNRSRNNKRKAKRNNRKPKWLPLDLNEDPPVPATEQNPELAITIAGPETLGNGQPRGPAPSSTEQPTHLFAPPTTTSPPTFSHHTSHKQQNHSYKNRSRREKLNQRNNLQNNHQTDGKMGGLAASACVPPHLRKKAPPADNHYVPPHRRKAPPVKEQDKPIPLAPHLRKKASSQETGGVKLSSVPPHLRPDLHKQTASAAKIEVAADASGPAANGQPVRSNQDTCGSKTPSPGKLRSSPNAFKPKSQITPPSTMNELENSFHVFGALPPPSPPPEPKNKPRTSRVPRQKHVWPKNRDMKPLPSDQHNSEDGNWPKFDVNSNSSGDPDHDVKQLVDWKGDWMPPPPEWAARKTFHNRHPSDTIAMWARSLSDELCNVINIGSKNDLRPEFEGKPVEGEEVLIDQKVVSKKFVNSEVVPNYWIPQKIEGEAPSSFWNTFPLREPSPLSEADITEPWWERVCTIDPECFMVPLPVPDAKPNPEEEDSDIAIRLRGQTFTANEFVRRREARIKELRRIKYEKEHTPVPPPKFYIPPLPDTRLKPEANVYLRPVREEDASGITDIYNYYIQKTTAANEFEVLTPNQMLHRISDIKSQGLPFIVAVSRSNPIDKRNPVRERIVGFAHLDDFVGRTSMFRFAFELEFYTHPGYIRKGIAKCLLDKLLSCVNTGYELKGGYDWENNGDYLKNGSMRRVKTININLPHELTDEGKQTMVWMFKFLKSYDFKRSGHLKEMGYKHGKEIEIEMFQYHTSETVNPNDIPLGPNAEIPA